MTTLEQIMYLNDKIDNYKKESGISLEYLREKHRIAVELYKKDIFGELEFLTALYPDQTKHIY